MNVPLVSVVFLTYNSAEKFLNLGDSSILRKALDALLAQDYPNFEILIFDDCSFDSTYEICLEYQKNNSNVKVFQNNQNLGVIRNLFQAIWCISGEYFLWAYPDDSWSKDFLSSAIRVLENQKECVAAMSKIKVCSDYSDPYYISYENLKNYQSKLKLAISVVTSKNSEGEYISYNQFIHGVIRTKFLKKIFINSPGIWITEELIVVLMILYGGIAFVAGPIHTNFHTVVPLNIRNPLIDQLRKNPTIQMQGIICFLKTVFTSDINIKLKLQSIIVVLPVFYNHYAHRNISNMKSTGVKILKEFQTLFKLW